MEPGTWKLHTWKNIPIYVHWTILLWLPWYWLHNSSLFWAAATFLAYALLLLAHEAGHAIAARSRRLGVYAIRLYMMHGLCQFQAPYREKDHILIAWGGVIAQMCVLVVAVAAQFAVELFLPGKEYLLAPLFYVFIKANIVIAVFNLIPVEPLDGHIAWRGVAPLWNKLRTKFRNRPRATGNVIDFGKRREAARKSRDATQDLLDKLRKK